MSMAFQNKSELAPLVLKSSYHNDDNIFDPSQNGWLHISLKADGQAIRMFEITYFEIN